MAARTCTSSRPLDYSLAEPSQPRARDSVGCESSLAAEREGEAEGHKERERERDVMTRTGTGRRDGTERDAPHTARHTPQK